MFRTSFNRHMLNTKHYTIDIKLLHIFKLVIWVWLHLDKHCFKNQQMGANSFKLDLLPQLGTHDVVNVKQFKALRMWKNWTSYNTFHFMLVMMTTKTRMMTIRIYPLSSIFISMFTVHSLIHGTHQAPSRYYKSVSIPQNSDLKMAWNLTLLLFKIQSIQKSNHSTENRPDFHAPKKCNPLESVFL